MSELCSFQIMWFSSGGTQSVVHTDAVDNINCVFDGSKEFVLIDPGLHVEKVKCLLVF